MNRLILCRGILTCLITDVKAGDLGQWEAVDPGMVPGLMQPDVPNASCCGEADAYWADEVHVKDGKTYAVITDDRPDEPRGRCHFGTELGTPKPAVFALSAATSVRRSTLFDPMMRSSF